MNLEEKTQKTYIFPLVLFSTDQPKSVKRRFFKIIEKTFFKHIRDKNIFEGKILVGLKTDAEEIAKLLSSHLPDYSFEIKSYQNYQNFRKDFYFIEFKKSPLEIL